MEQSKPVSYSDEARHSGERLPTNPSNMKNVMIFSFRAQWLFRFESLYNGIFASTFCHWIIRPDHCRARDMKKTKLSNLVMNQMIGSAGTNWTRFQSHFFTRLTAGAIRWKLPVSNTYPQRTSLPSERPPKWWCKLSEKSQWMQPTPSKPLANWPIWTSAGSLMVWIFRKWASRRDTGPQGELQFKNICLKAISVGTG